MQKPKLKLQVNMAEKLCNHWLLDEPQTNCAEWKKPDRRVYTVWFCSDKF